MPPPAILTIHAYVASEAYAQSAPLAISSALPSVTTAPTSSYETASPPVFFPSGTARTASAGSPYRSLLFVDFRRHILPQDVVDYLLNQSFMTGRYYSAFRHGPASAPEGYEIREGSPSGCDRSILGGEIFDALEELFFATTWVAHVHPPMQSPLPTNGDLAALAERAKLAGGRLVRHSLFGFHRGEPVCIELQAFYDPLFREVSVLYRTSDALATATDQRIQEFISSYR